MSQLKLAVCLDIKVPPARQCRTLLLALHSKRDCLVADTPALSAPAAKARRVLIKACCGGLSFLLCATSAQGEAMRRAVRSQQVDLFNPPNTPLAVPQAVRTELVRLLCALLLEAMPPQPSPTITAERGQA